MSGAGIVPAVGPLLPIGIGLVALAIGAAILRSFGPNYRIGRLLAAAPVVSVREALDLAGGPPRYVGVRGRIDAEDEFEDDAHRPLVLRRARIQLRDGGLWTTVDEHVQSVPFVVREGLDDIAIDVAAIGPGLVVVLRESVGTAADAPDRVPAGTPDATPLRLRVEQISSVEHATVIGVPLADPATGAVRMTAGLGRPLIVTTLEAPEAMRILASSGPRRPLLAAISLAVGAIGLTVGFVWALIEAATGVVLAASPEPTRSPGGDPRSSGEGPGLVGEPLFAVGVVIAIGLLAALVTFAYVRLTDARRRTDDRGPRRPGP